LPASPYGDTKQHHSVQWGDALRILERSGVIAQAELTKIYRQRIPQLREAIEDLSKGRTLEGFNKLDKFGVLQEISDDAVRLTIAEKQIEALQAQRSSLIIAPTHGECRAIASAVRQAMKEKPTVRHRTFRHGVEATESGRDHPHSHRKARSRRAA
jgi:ATP-dependent exoDNAse (exonuclease V) alpha subunit